MNKNLFSLLIPVVPVLFLSACIDEEVSKANLEKASVKIQQIAEDGEVIDLGSGFFIGDEGYIVTNNHVVAGVSTLEISGSGFTGLATHVAANECADLAVIKLVEADSSSYAGLEWYQGTPQIGTKIGTGGFPANTQSSHSEGSYTYFEGIINTNPKPFGFPLHPVDAFIHDAAISPGSSGGAVIELQTGKVVGVNFGGLEDNNRKAAISLDIARINVEKMILGEDVPSIGIFGRFASIDNNTGVRVVAINSDSKAEATGIRPDDLIVKAGDTDLDDGSNALLPYCEVLQTHTDNNPDNILSIEIYRPDIGEFCVGEINGEELTLKDDSSQSCPLESIKPSSSGENTISGELDSDDFQSDSGEYIDHFDVIAQESGMAMVTVDSLINGITIGIIRDRDSRIIDNVSGKEFDVVSGELFRMIVFGDSDETGSYELTLNNLKLSKELK
ncbi:MAG: trypsin-like peptidase domain-containing protein [Gammaproteobacteria bacterium]|nr:trypsin-like peptidase domain-containing protein [Gammaproteobacteria bacterium]